MDESDLLCCIVHLNSFLAVGDFCCPLISYVNSLDQGHNVGPDLDPNGFIMTLIVFLKELFEKVHFEKMSIDSKK